MSTRVLVVDDSALVRDQLAGLVTRELGAEVVATADHGVQAVDLASALRPSLITLDVQMPVMNGLVALKHIMVRRPVPVVMVSAFTSEESHVTFDCLRYGALDFVPKPGRSTEGDLEHDRRLIVHRLRRAASPEAPSGWFCRLQRLDQVPVPPPTSRLEKLVLVVGGRGAVAPLLKLLNTVPSGCTAAALIVLDLPNQVVESLAMYLSRFSALPVKVVTRDTEMRPGVAYLLPASRACVATRNGTGVCLVPVSTPEGSVSHAFVAGMLVSLAETFRSGALAVFLSGASAVVGGCLDAVRSNGGEVFIQDPVTALEGDSLGAAAALLRARTQVGQPDRLACEVAAHIRRGQP